VNRLVLELSCTIPIFRKAKLATCFDSKLLAADSGWFGDFLVSMFNSNYATCGVLWNLGVLYE
jgi:hypothetical protein